MRILRIKEVIKKTSIGRTKLYEMMESGDFPGSIKLGAKSVGWVDTEVEEWIQSRITERDNDGTTINASTV